MNLYKAIFALIVTVGIILVFDTYSEAQCAMCRATVESNNASGKSTIGSGLNTGILYLMSIPYLLFAVIGYYWYKLSKKNHEQRAKIQSIIKGKMSQMS